MRCQYLESTELKKKAQIYHRSGAKGLCVRNWHTKIPESEGESA